MGDLLTLIENDPAVRAAIAAIASVDPPVTGGLTVAQLIAVQSVRSGLRVSNALIVPVADSIGVGYQALNGGWPVRLAVGPSVVIDLRFTASGTTQAQAFAAAKADNSYSSLHSTSKPLIWTLQRIVNDLLSGADGTTLYNTCTKPFTSLLQSFGGYVQLVTCPPFSAGLTPAMEASRLAYNALVRGNVAGADIIVDLASNPLIGDGTDTATTVLRADGLHFTDEGQDYCVPTYEAGYRSIVTVAGRPYSLCSAPVRAPAAALSALSLSPATATAGVPYSGTLSGVTAGSSITATSSDGTALAVSGTTVSATFATAGAYTVTVVEALSGVSNSPRTSTALLTVSAASAGGSTVNALTLSSDAAFAGGKFSQGQSAGYGTIPAGLLPASTTIDFWYISTSTGFQVFMGQPNGGWYVGVNAGSLFSTQTSGPVSGSPNLADGVPHHLVLQLSATASTFIVDDVPIYSGAGTTVTNEATYFRQYNGSFPVVGVTDELAIFNGARTSATPTAPYTGSEANLLALYHLNGDGLNFKVNP